MYLVDTNVISEIAKKDPDAKALAWITEHDSELFLSSITIEEMRFGALALPKGKRRTQLQNTVDEIVATYESRIWVFDAAAAECCAEYHVSAISIGRTPTIEDLMIAAIATCHGATVVTRNIRDFDYLGVDTLNPFQAD